MNEMNRELQNHSKSELRKVTKKNNIIKSKYGM